ncbi:MAG: hypothetical protein H6Q06_1750 [Acidobacteria bacterium]|nr:hypothetical protein [Acidobacteriota bacterium]
MFKIEHFSTLPGCIFLVGWPESEQQEDTFNFDVAAAVLLANGELIFDKDLSTNGPGNFVEGAISI